MSDEIILTVKTSFGFVGCQHEDDLYFELDDFAGPIYDEAGARHRAAVEKMVEEAAAEAANQHLEWYVTDQEDGRLDEIITKLIERANAAIEEQG